MAKPPILQQLTKGKFLCAKNAPDFVETFNYCVNRLENLKGDRDINPNNGVISVDNTDPEHPVIRAMLPQAQAGGAAETMPTPFELVTADDGTMSIINNKCYCQDTLIALADFADVPSDGTVYLNLTGSRKTDSSTTKTYSYTWAGDISTTAKGPAEDAVSHKVYYSLPLYTFVGSVVTMDYRDTFLRVNPARAERGVCSVNFATISNKYETTTDTAKLVTVPLYSSQLDMGHVVTAEATEFHVPLVVDGTGAIHKIKDADGNTLSCFFGTADVTISASGAISGISQDVNVVTSVSYDTSTHKLTYQMQTITFESGIAKAITTAVTKEIATAVEET